MTPEEGVRLAVRQMLEMHGFATYDLEQNRPTRQTAGLADIYAVKPGVLAVWLECKAGKGRLTPPQILFRDLHVGLEVGPGCFPVWSASDALHVLAFLGVSLKTDPERPPSPVLDGLFSRILDCRERRRE